MRAMLRIAAITVLALGLGACDKCGNWFGQGKTNACTTETPR